LRQIVPANIPAWRKNAIEIIGSVADESFQRDAWFGKGRYVSSPEAIYNQVFSDLAFEMFVESPEICLNDLQKAAAKKLIEKMRSFEKAVDSRLLPEQVIDHPAWIDVRRAAKTFLKLFEQ